MNKIITTMLFAVLSISAFCQDTKSFDNFSDDPSYASYNQHLFILRNNGKTIKVSYYYTIKIEETNAWKSLLSSFLDDFAKVKDQFPEYKYFNILYTENDNLIVNEIRGKEVYSFSDQNKGELQKTNYCILKGDGVIIQFELETYDEMLDPEIKDELTEAISNVKSKRTFDFSIRNEKFYDTNLGEMIKNPNRGLELDYVTGANFGFLANRPTLTPYGIMRFSIDQKNYLYGRAEFGVSSFNLFDEQNPVLYPGIGAGYMSRFTKRNSETSYAFGMEAMYLPGSQITGVDFGIKMVAYLKSSKGHDFRLSYIVYEDQVAVGMDIIALPTFSLTTKF